MYVWYSQSSNYGVNHNHVHKQPLVQPHDFKLVLKISDLQFQKQTAFQTVSHFHFILFPVACHLLLYNAVHCTDRIFYLFIYLVVCYSHLCESKTRVRLNFAQKTFSCQMEVATLAAIHRFLVNSFRCLTKCNHNANTPSSLFTANRFWVW